MAQLKEVSPRRSHLAVTLLFCLIAAGVARADEQTPLNPALKPDESPDVGQVFQDVGVVQKKAMEKQGRFLLSTFGSVDLSDGPYSSYAFQLNPGYAINDFFEIYLNFVPAFVSTKRSIVDRVEQLQLANGQQATITASKPKLQYGLDLVWAPLYGKDSLGLKKIVRSDTFLKFGVAKVNYDVDSGMRFNLGIGKTFFLDRWVGVRLTVTESYWQTIVDSIKEFRFLTVIEAGPVFYF